MDNEQQKALAMLKAVYPNTIVGEAGAAVWAHFLCQIPGDALCEIVEDWIASEAKPPAIANLMERWRVRNGTDAESVWHLVERIVRNGEWRDRTKMGAPALPFGFTGDPALEAAVRAAGGWSAFGKATEQETVWLKKSFMEAYRETSATHRALLSVAMREQRGELTDGAS